MTRPHGILVNELISSLERDPAEWLFTEFRAINRRSNISVWVANGAAGLHIEGAGAKIGDVTVYSVFFGWLPWGWRARLLNAVHRAQVQSVRAALAQ